jgi:hypothetical protein
VTSNVYSGGTFALVTRHGKERAIGPALSAHLGAGLVVLHDIDTDQLGTFTRDIPRRGTQRDAARHKARLAIERGHRLGLGSEGAFVPGPFGMGAFDIELLLLIDVELGIEVLGHASAPGRHHHDVVATREELTAFVHRAGFPDHGFVVRPDDENDPRIRKGLRTVIELDDAFLAAQRESHTGRVFVENDLRAHHNPTRMAIIAEAARDLVTRLTSPCPSCTSPGFGLLGRIPGLPCQWCGAPTAEAIADEYGCVRCEHRERRPRSDVAFADPGRCDRCNP